MLVGPSGCGKSTLLRCLNRMHETVPTARIEGHVTLDGRDVYWFVGGPLDGRVHTREPDDPPPPVVRHTHLHDGPKIVHYYDLTEVAGHGGDVSLINRHGGGLTARVELPL